MIHRTALLALTLALGACQPAGLTPAPIAAAPRAAGLFLDAADGGTARATLVPRVGAGRRLLAAGPPYDSTMIATTEVSLYRLGGPSPVFRRADALTGDPSDATITIGALRAGTSYRVVFVATDAGGTTLSQADQQVDFAVDAAGGNDLDAAFTIALLDLDLPSGARTLPGFHVIEGATPVKGLVLPRFDLAPSPAPRGAALAADGALFVASGAGVDRYLADGTLDTGFATAGLQAPVDVALDAAGAYLYVADAGAGAIVKVPVAGGTAIAVATLEDPAAVAIGPDGAVYAAAGHRIARVGPDGAVATYVAAEELAKATLSSQLIGDSTPEAIEIDNTKLATRAAQMAPAGLRFDGGGKLWFVEQGRKGLWSVAPDRTLKPEQGPFSGTPVDAVVGTDERIYVACADGTVWVTDGSTPLLLAGGGGVYDEPAAGTAAGFDALTALAMDASGFLYAVEAGATPRVRQIR